MKHRLVRTALVIGTIILTAPQAIAYEHDHYVWTYYLALQVGYTPRQAYQIASGAYAIDWDTDTGPMGTSNDWWDIAVGVPSDELKHQWTEFHGFGRLATKDNPALDLQLTEEAKGYLWKLAVSERNPGPYIHYLQDFQAHGGYYDDYGHAMALHEPDFISRNEEAATRMTDDTLTALQRFMREVLKKAPKPINRARIDEVLARLIADDTSYHRWAVAKATAKGVPAMLNLVGGALLRVAVGAAVSPPDLPNPNIDVSMKVIRAAIKEDEESGRLPKWLESGRYMIPDKWLQYDFSGAQFSFGRVIDHGAHVNDTAEKAADQQYSVENLEITFGDVKAIVDRRASGAAVTLTVPYTVKGIAEIGSSIGPGVELAETLDLIPDGQPVRTYNSLQSNILAGPSQEYSLSAAYAGLPGGRMQWRATVQAVGMEPVVKEGVVDLGPATATPDAPPQAVDLLVEVLELGTSTPIPNAMVELSTGSDPDRRVYQVRAGVANPVPAGDYTIKATDPSGLHPPATEGPRTVSGPGPETVQVFLSVATGSLSVQALDAQSLAPVTGVVVSAVRTAGGRAEQVTAPDTRALPPGAYVLTVIDPGPTHIAGRPATATVTIGGSVSATLTLGPKTAASSSVTTPAQGPPRGDQLICDIAKPSVVEIGHPAKLAVVWRDWNTQVVANPRTKWTVSRDDLAWIDRSGLFTAKAPGVVVVFAQNQDRTDTDAGCLAQLTVVDPTGAKQPDPTDRLFEADVDQCTIAGMPASLTQGQQASLTVTAFNWKRERVTAGPFEWFVSEGTNHATIDRTSGVLTTIAPGDVTVTAAFGSVLTAESAVCQAHTVVAVPSGPATTGSAPAVAGLQGDFDALEREILAIKADREALVTRNRLHEDAIRRFQADLQTSRTTREGMLHRLDPMVNACQSMKTVTQIDPRMIATAERQADEVERSLTAALKDVTACASADVPARAERAVKDAFEVGAGIERLAVAVNPDADALVDTTATLRDGASVLSQLGTLRDDIDRQGMPILKEDGLLPDDNKLFNDKLEAFRGRAGARLAALESVAPQGGNEGTIWQSLVNRLRVEISQLTPVDDAGHSRALISLLEQHGNSLQTIDDLRTLLADCQAQAARGSGGVALIDRIDTARTSIALALVTLGKDVSSKVAACKSTLNRAGSPGAAGTSTAPSRPAMAPPPPDQLLKDIVVTTRTITVKVWDYGCVDGDQVTVRIGGKTIFDHYTLAKEPASRTVTLTGAENEIELVSDSGGTDCPQTTAKTINSGAIEISGAATGGSQQWQLAQQDSTKAKIVVDPTRTAAAAGGTGAGATAAASAGPGGAAAARGGTATALAVSGEVTVRDGDSSHALQKGQQIAAGASLHVGAASSVTVGATTHAIKVGQNSAIGMPRAPSRFLDLSEGTVDVDTHAGIGSSVETGPSFDGLETAAGRVRHDGTRYRVQASASETNVEVFEGLVHLTGTYIMRIGTGDQNLGKRAPATELTLHAGERAVMLKIARPTEQEVSAIAPRPTRVPRTGVPDARAVFGGASKTPVTPAAPVSGVPAALAPRPAAVGAPTTAAGASTTALPAALLGGRPASATTPSAAGSAITRPDPWNDGRVQGLIDEWLRDAVAGAPAIPVKYNEWAQPLARGAVSTGPPDHGNMTRYEYLWSTRARWTSNNLCTLGDFIDRRVGGRGLDGCSVPAFLAQSTAPSGSPAAAAAAPEASSALDAIGRARQQLDQQRQRDEQQRRLDEERRAAEARAAEERRRQQEEDQRRLAEQRRAEQERLAAEQRARDEQKQKEAAAIPRADDLAGVLSGLVKAVEQIQQGTAAPPSTPPETPPPPARPADRPSAVQNAVDFSGTWRCDGNMTFSADDGQPVRGSGTLVIRKTATGYEGSSPDGLTLRSTRVQGSQLRFEGSSQQQGVTLREILDLELRGSQLLVSGEAHVTPKSGTMGDFRVTLTCTRQENQSRK